MRLDLAPFRRDRPAAHRQLINKTNQFNLTTRRYTEEDVRADQADARASACSFGLLDRFGDNGIIAIIIGRTVSADATISDRHLADELPRARPPGRGGDTEHCRRASAAARRHRLIGEYRPTSKNGMVKDHYPKLGFAPLEVDEKGHKRDVLDLGSFATPDVIMAIREG